MSQSAYTIRLDSDFLRNVPEGRALINPTQAQRSVGLIAYLCCVSKTRDLVSASYRFNPASCCSMTAILASASAFFLRSFYLFYSKQYCLF
jgi:hypothetical protein